MAKKDTESTRGSMATAEAAAYKKGWQLLNKEFPGTSADNRNYMETIKDNLSRFYTRAGADKEAAGNLVDGLIRNIKREAKNLKKYKGQIEARKKKMGGGKIKKNYAPGGRITSDKDSAPGGRMISAEDLRAIRNAVKSGEEVSGSDLKLLEKMVEGGFVTGVSDLIARITKKNYTEKQKNKKGRIESDFLSGKKKMGGGKIKKNYAKGGGVRPASY